MTAGTLNPQHLREIFQRKELDRIRKAHLSDLLHSMLTGDQLILGRDVRPIVTGPQERRSADTPVSYTHLDVYKRQTL